MRERNYTRLGEIVWTEKLANGLQIFVVTKPEFAKTYAFFAVKYGGMDMRFEEDGQWRDTPAGVAHFLEHKMFDTEDGNALQVLAANGAQPNAFTGSDMTAYYFDSTENFEENLRTLLSFVSVPWFTRESVDKEQGIIGQEIRMGEDDPSLRCYYDMLEALYDHLPVRTSVAGTVESIADITADTLYACHRAFYQPANMCLCVVGDVDPNLVRRAAEEILPRQSGRADISRDYGEPEEPRAVTPRRERRMEVSMPLFMVGWKCDAPLEGPESLRQELIHDLAYELLMGESSPLYTRLYEQGLVNKNFGGGWDRVHGGACFYAGGESRDPDAVRDAIAEEAQRIGREGLDEAFFQRTLRALYGSRLRRLNSFDSVCIELATAYFYGSDYYTFAECYDTITKEDAEQCIRTCFTPERTALAVVLPLEDSDSGEE